MTLLNGCHNHAPYKDSFGGYAVDSKTSEIKFFKVPNQNTKECQYQHTELGKADKGCEQCKWKKHDNEN